MLRYMQIEVALPVEPGPRNLEGKSSLGVAHEGVRRDELCRHPLPAGADHVANAHPANPSGRRVAHRRVFGESIDWAQMIPFASLGYQFQQPGPSDWGPAIDNVPVPSRTGDIARAHAMWREQVEAEMVERLESGRLSTWYPVALPSEQPIVPLIGGNPAQDWTEAVDVLITQALDGGAQEVQVLDLTRYHVWKRQQKGSQADGRNDDLVMSSSLAPGRSSADVFGGLEIDDVIALVVDVLRADDDRSDRNTAAMRQAALGDVARELNRPEVTPELLAEAVRYALSLDPGVTSLAADEMTRLDAFHHHHIQTRRGLADDLDVLERLLASVSRFTQAGPPSSHGSLDDRTVILRGIEPGLSDVDYELARGLLAARLAREMNDPDPRHGPVTILLGADHLPEATLSTVTSAALRTNSLLFLFYENFAGTALTQIGSAGASVGGFFRLGNTEQALAAAEFMGKEYKFELAGYSQNENRSFEEGWSNTAGIDRSTSQSWQTGRMLSKTMTAGISRSESSTTSRSSSRSTGGSTNMERVYEYLLDPAVFKALPPASLMVVNTSDRAALLVSCSRDVQRSQLVSRDHCYELTA